MKELWNLFWVFAKVGTLTFGGGYAIMPILEKELARNLKWSTPEELMDYYALGQCVPGIIAVNTSTFIGYKRKGVSGALAATFGVVFPSIVFVGLVALVLEQFTRLPVVAHAFAGIRVCICALIVDMVIRLWPSGVTDVPCLIIFWLSFALMLFAALSPVTIIIAAAVYGVGITWWGGRRK